MKYAKVGTHVSVLVGDRFFHAQVTDVVDQDEIEVDLGGVATPALRLSDPPNWQVNRFEA